jgi:ABC-type nitrate/sulfonate/bicarbonate transport system permease component
MGTASDEARVTTRSVALAVRRQLIPSGDRPRRTAALLLMALAWEVTAALLRFPFLPPLSSVLAALWQLTVEGEILGHLLPSLISLLLGYALGGGLGLALGALLARHPLLDRVLDPYVSAMLAAPNLVFVPILAALLGVGRPTQVAVIFLYVFFLVTATTASAIRMADGALVAMARSFGAGDRQLFWKILVPSSAPMILGGLRIGLVRGVKGMIGGEMLVALTGLGALARTYGSRFDTERALAVLVVIMAVALVGAGRIEALEWRWAGWRDRRA